MSVYLGLKKIATLELDKKILLLKLFDAYELLNNVKTENMFLLDKVKNLEHELFIAREQTNRSASSVRLNLFNHLIGFIQPFNWLYSVPNLLVIQHLVTLYLGGFVVRVVSEIE